ncbi:MAG: hypothetical protein E7077_14625 [Bacteroidales bacterium]|jgi:hypothetical protein|nr:hypothetical protein [Bacteroidales bacterium]
MRKKNYTSNLKRAFTNYRWWDYGFMLQFEKAIWQDWYNIYNEGKNTVSTKDRDRYLANTAKLAIKLLDMLDKSWIEYEDFDWEFEKINPDDPNSCLRLKNDNVKGWLKKGIYVNTRNHNRFFVSQDFNGTIHDISDLRNRKIWHLYNMLREYRLEIMFD